MAGRPIRRARQSSRPSRGTSRASACPARGWLDDYLSTPAFLVWEMGQSPRERKAGYALVEALMDTHGQKLADRGWKLGPRDVVITHSGPVAIRTACHASMRNTATVLCMRKELD